VLACTLSTLFDQGSGSTADKRKRRASAASAVCSFFSSALGQAKSTSTHLSEKGIAEYRKTRALSLETHDALATYEWQSSTRSGLARVASAKWLTNGLGAVGAFAESVAYYEDWAKGMEEAKTGDSPDRIWILPGLGMVGSAVAGIGYCLLCLHPAGAVLVAAGIILGAVATFGGVFWPGLVASDAEKWLMHCFVGKHHASANDAKLGFTKKKTLAEYHSDLALQIDGVDYVLFDFTPTCEIIEEHGHKWLKVDVRFRHLKAHSKVILKLYGRKRGVLAWTELGTNEDWVPRVGGQPYDARTKTKAEGAAPFFDRLPTMGYDEMKIGVQIDVLGDGSYLYPKDPKEFPEDKK
jgi:hypothetical protein